MHYYDYSSLKEVGFGFGWLDITGYIKDTMAMALTKNITEYWVQENTNYDVPMAINRNPDALLDWADKEGLAYLMVAATGNNLSKRNNLFNELPKYLDENRDNITVVGHILDRGDKFYELHYQCFLINMNWWRSVGKPKIGNEEQNLAWETVCPQRSDENWHDEYTPHWIQRGTEVKKYTGRRFGWNILNEALKSDGRVNSFSAALRESKYYIYPEVERDFHSKIGEVFSSLQCQGHFAANTESPPDRFLDADLTGVICTASGITPLLTAYIANLKPYNKLTVFDFSPLSIALQRELRRVNCDYKNFKQTFDELSGSLRLESMYKALININKMQEIIDTLMPQGLEDFIRDVWPTLDVCYAEINLFDVHSIKNLLNRHYNENTLVHLTNILHYQNSAWLYSTTHRYRIEADLLDLLVKYGMDSFYLYSNRPGRYRNWRFQTPRQILNQPERFLAKVKELEMLPWVPKSGN